MPENITPQREALPSIEQTPPSPALKIHIARGEFDRPDPSKPIDTTLPPKVDHKAFIALENLNNARRKADQEAFVQKVQATTDHPLSAEDIQHAHMFVWASHVQQALAYDLQLEGRGNKTALILRDKLGLPLTGNGQEDGHIVRDQLYNPETRTEGAFYKKFCARNMPEQLAHALSVDDMMHLKTFLVTWMLGTEADFAALVVLRQTMDDVAHAATKQATYAQYGQLPLDERDRLILTHFRKGLQLGEEKTSPGVEKAKPESVKGNDDAETSNQQSHAEYTKSLLRKSDSQPAPSMLVLANQIDKATAHFQSEGITNPEDLAVALTENFFKANTYGRIVEQDMFGPAEFERTEDISEVRKVLPDLQKSMQRLSKEKTNSGYDVNYDTFPWIHFHSPSYPENLSTAYRVYVNPLPTAMPEFLESLTTYAQEKNLPLYFKTVNPSHDTNLWRTDKVVVYLNTQNADDMVRFMESYASQHPDAFTGRVTPPSSTISLAPGVGLAAQPPRDSNDQEVTAGSRNAENLRKALTSLGVTNIQQVMSQYPSVQAFLDSPVYKKVIAQTVTNTNVVRPSLLGNDRMNRIFQESLFTTAFENHQTLQLIPDLNGDPQVTFSPSDIQKAFVKSLMQNGESHTATQINALSSTEFTKDYGNICRFDQNVLMKAGFSTSIYALLARGEDPRRIFLGQYDQVESTSSKVQEITTEPRGFTEKSTNHAENEDTYFLDLEHLRGGIFDGASGHYRGDIASQTAEKAVTEVLATLSSKATLEEVQQTIAEAMRMANDHVLQIPYPKDKKHPITTGTIYQLWKGPNGEMKLVFSSLGDSRLWIRKANGDIKYLTQDDNLLKKSQREGVISFEQYKELQRKIDTAQTQEDVTALGNFWNQGTVTAMLGEQDVNFHIITEDIEPGDMIVVTSDGIHDNLTLSQIQQIAQSTNNPQELSEQLLAQAGEVARSDSVRAKEDDRTAIAMTVPLAA